MGIDISYRLLNTGDELEFFNLIEKNRKRLENFFAGTVAKNKSFEETISYVNEVVEKAEKKIYLPYVIIDKSTTNMIGFIDLKNIDWKIPKAEVGYFIDEGYEGKGLITKALSIIIEHCFSDMKFNKLFLRTHNGNVSSKAVAEKNGFIIEGIIRNDYRTTDGELVDLLYYGLTRNN